MYMSSIHVKKYQKGPNELWKYSFLKVFVQEP